MSGSLKPWTKAAFELIVHAELHLRKGGDFDRRIAHIGFDNAIEVAITTYLVLNPIQRNNRSYKREDINRWMMNYHTKLAFLEKEAQARGRNLKVPPDEVIFYHDIRNGQYHTGGPGVPEWDYLIALRSSALDTFAMLFGVDDVEQVLDECLQQRLVIPSTRPSRNSTVDKLLDMTDEPVFILGQPYTVSEVLYATDPEAYGAVAAAVMESRNVLAELSDKYPNCVQPTIVHIGFVHHGETVYLKVVDTEGEVNLTDTEFISGEGLDDHFFSQSYSPDGNADRLVKQLDPYSIVNCFEIFTNEAVGRIAEAYQAGTLGSLFQHR